MGRRGSPGIQVAVLIGVVLFFIYGFYSYNELKSALRKSEDSFKRATLNEENLSTQLQALVEQKNRLEESIKQEKELSKKEKDDLVRAKTDLEMKCKKDKTALNDRMESLTDELSKAKDSLQELQKKCETDSQHENEQAKLIDDYKILLQERSNAVAKLRDEVANLKNANGALQRQVKQKLQVLKKADQEKSVKDRTANEGNEEHENAANAVQVDNNNNRIPQMNNGDTQQEALDKANDNNQENNMQIRGPDENEKVAYFKPKTAKPDHPVYVAAPVAAAADNGLHVKPGPNHPPQREQVAPPKVDDTDDRNANNPLEQRESDGLRRGVRARSNMGGNLGHPANPVVAHDMDHQQGAVDNGESNMFGRRGPAGSDHIDGGRGHADKPLQIVEPQLHRDEEDQLQGPGLRNERNGNNEEDGVANDENEGEDYQYENARKEKAAKRDAVDGPHAVPVEDDDDDDNKAGLR